MKIGFSIEAINQYSGTSRSTYEVAKCAAKAHQVSFLVRRNELTDRHSFSIRLFPKFANIPILGRLWGAWFASKHADRMHLDIHNAVGSEALKQDIVTAQSVHKRWYFQSLGLTKRWSLDFWKKILNPLHYVTMIIESIQYLDHNHRAVIAISHQVKRDLIEHYGVKPEKIHVIHHGVNREDFTPMIDPSRKKEMRSLCKASDKDLLLLFVGHEFKRKGLKIALECLAKADSRFRLAVIGKDHFEKYQDQVNTLNLTDRVTYLGLQKNVGAWYAACDAFIFPTQYDAFGMVVTEAMAAGLPVVVPKDVGAAELIIPNETGLLVNAWDDKDDICSQLSKLLDDDFRHKMSQAARKATESMTWEGTADKVMSLFEAVARQKS